MSDLVTAASAITLGLLPPVLAASVAWYLNEKGRRQRDEYVRREVQYQKLIVALRGFYVATVDRTMRQEFLDQVNLCWLYCPDDVVRSAYGFLATVHTGAGDAIAGNKELAAGELIAAIRRDLLSRRTIGHTDLVAADFKHLAAT